ncbi:MAG: DUF4280 domain-containing protein [Chloroflexi bacterium]|nr:DUF4280 domain-containing protein [Chloroflexota bacterium]
MSEIVVNGAMLACTMAMPPGTSTFAVLPTTFVNAEGKPAATIMDNKPMANIPPFGMCKSQLNPATAAATAAALGTPTPGPCTPIIPAPWAPGSSTVMVGNKPALTSSSSCMCTAGGTISIKNAGQKSTSTK